MSSKNLRDSNQTKGSLKPTQENHLQKQTEMQKQIENLPKYGIAKFGNDNSFNNQAPETARYLVHLQVDTENCFLFINPLLRDQYIIDTTH